MQTQLKEDYGRFSPGCSPRWLAFQSDESGRKEVYIDTFPQPRGKKTVSTDGGSWPQWGPGGDELFYITPDTRLMAATVWGMTWSYAATTRTTVSVTLAPRARMAGKA